MGPDFDGSHLELTFLLPFIIIPVLGGLLFTFSCGKGRQAPTKAPPGVASHKAPRKSIREGPTGELGDLDKPNDGLQDDDQADNNNQKSISQREGRISRSQRLKRLFSAKKREQKLASEREANKSKSKSNRSSKSVTKFEKVAPPPPEREGGETAMPDEAEPSQTKLLGARADEEEEPPPFEAAFAAANDETAQAAANPETPDGTGVAGTPPTVFENRPVPSKQPQLPPSELDVRMSDAAGSEKAAGAGNKKLMPVDQVRPVSPAGTPTGAVTPSPTPSPAGTPAAGADDKEKDESDSDKSSKRASKKHKKKKHSKKKKKHKKAKPTPNVTTAIVPLPPVDGVTRYENLYPQVISKPPTKEVTGVNTTVTEDKMIEMTKEHFLTGVNPRKMAEFLEKRPPVLYTGIDDEPSERRFNNGVSSKFIAMPKSKPPTPRARSPSPKQSVDATQIPGSGDLAPTQWSGLKPPSDGTQGTAVSCFDKTQLSATPQTRQDTTAPTQGGTTLPSQGIDGTQPDRRTTMGTTQKTDTNIEATQPTNKKTKVTYRTAQTQPDTIVGTPIGSRDAPTQKTRATTVGPTQAGTTMDPTQNTSMNLDGTQIPDGSIEIAKLPKTHIDPTQVISFNAATNPTQGTLPSMDQTQVKTNPTLELAATQRSNSVRKTLPSAGLDKTQNGPPTFDATQTMNSQKGTIMANTGLTTKARSKSLADPTQPDPTTSSAADTDTVAAVKEIGPTMKSSFVHSFPEGTTQPTMPNSIPSLISTQWGQTLPTTQITTTANTAATGSQHYDKCPVEKKTPSESGEMVTATRITLTENYPKPISLPKTPKEKRIAEQNIKCKPDDYPTFNDVVSDWGTADDDPPLVTAKATTESPAGTSPGNPVSPASPALTPVHPDTVKLRQLEEEDERKHMDRRRNVVARKKADDEKRRREAEDEDRLRKRKLEEDRVKQLRANAPKPRTFARNTYEDKIAAGKIVRRKHDYPTMNDIKSDWDSTDTDTGGEKGKNNEK